jgi:hypothetical protein
MTISSSSRPAATHKPDNPIQHSPLPWRFSPHEDGMPIIDSTSKRVCDIDVLCEPEDDAEAEVQARQQDADADFIVAACNAHHHLVAVVQTFVDMVHSTGQADKNKPLLPHARVALKLAGMQPMKQLKDLSRTAQLVALTHFLTGTRCEVTFSARRFAQLDPRHVQGLQELEHNGMVCVTRTRQAVTYTATVRIGRPIIDVPAMRMEEAYPLFPGSSSQ